MTLDKLALSVSAAWEEVLIDSELERLHGQVLRVLQKVERDTWKKAAEQVSECMTHYEDKMGDPNGCLLGLAVEFSANARGDGPDNMGKK